METPNYQTNQNNSGLLTIRQAAKQLNLPYRQLLEEVDHGAIPYYRIGRGRRLVCLNEILRIIKSTGAQND